MNTRELSRLKTAALRRRRSITLTLALMLAFSVGIASSSVPVNDSILISGSAAHSLLQAFKAFPGDMPERQAPFVLSSYSVQILHRSDEDVVAFYPNIGRFPFVAHIRGGRVVGQDNLQPTLDVPALLLPGVIAGEIIATYAKAYHDGDVVASGDPASFDVGVDVWAGGPLIGFVPKVLPEYYRTHACVTGNCNGRSVYRVELEPHAVNITRRSIL